jgi:hypothetical protein
VKPTSLRFFSRVAELTLFRFDSLAGQQSSLFFASILRLIWFITVGNVDRHSRSYGGWEMGSADSINLLFPDWHSPELTFIGV